MGLRTSVYLTDELEAAWKASGVPLGELVRRGLGERAPEQAAAAGAAEAVRDEIRAALAGLAMQGGVDALESLGDELQDRIDRAVERALRKMQGG